MFESAVIVYKPVDVCLEKARSISRLLNSQGIETSVITVDDLPHVEKTGTGGNCPEIDLLVSVGGDGTFLRSVRTFISSGGGPLILPWACGRRNAFYEYHSLSVEKVVEIIMGGNFFVELLPRLSVCYSDKCTYFLNDVVVVSTNLGKVSTYSIEVLSPMVRSGYSFEGDGVVVSTSPGSSGYNLSARGPLLAPLTEAIVVTYLNPLQLGMPALVLSPLAKVKVLARNESYLYVDGDLLAVLKKNDSIVITNGFNYIKVIRLSAFRDVMRVAIEHRQRVF